MRLLPCLLMLALLLLCTIDAETIANSKETTELGSNSSQEVEQPVQQRLQSQQTATAPTLARLGKWSVGFKELNLTHGNQLSATDFSSRHERTLKVDVWYPSDALEGGKAAIYHNQTRSGNTFSIQGVAYQDLQFAKSKSGFPLIVISHGYTGYRSMMYYLAEHLASHGYIVAGIDHTDSTNADVDFKVNPGSGFPSTLLNRARDQQFVLDSLTGSRSVFAPIVKAESAAVIGYSMGGYGAINTVGGCYSFSEDSLQGLGFPKESAENLLPLFNTCSAAREKVDSRWQAMIAIAPWGGEQNVHDPEALAKVTLPSFIIAGEHDDVSGFDNGVKKLYQQLGANHKYLLVYENARHNIAAHPAPKVAYQNDLDIGHYHEPNWNSETIAQINKHMVLAFLDCHIKNSIDMCDSLPSREHALQQKTENGSMSKPWPGFADRWSIGLRFLRNNASVKKD